MARPLLSRNRLEVGVENNAKIIDQENHTDRCPANWCPARRHASGLREQPRVPARTRPTAPIVSGRTPHNQRETVPGRHSTTTTIHRQARAAAEPPGPRQKGSLRPPNWQPRSRALAPVNVGSTGRIAGSRKAITAAGEQVPCANPSASRDESRTRPSQRRRSRIAPSGTPTLESSRPVHGRARSCQSDQREVERKQVNQPTPVPNGVDAEHGAPRREVDHQVGDVAPQPGQQERRRVGTRNRE